jgi:hypothetical protein
MFIEYFLPLGLESFIFQFISNTKSWIQNYTFSCLAWACNLVCLVNKRTFTEGVGDYGAGEDI